MKDDSLDPSSSDQNPGKEVWLSREEVLKRFNIPDRTLKYWRDEKKIIFKKVRNSIYYLESSITAKSKKYSRPKKFLGMRYAKKRALVSMNPVLAIDILAVAFWFAALPVPVEAAYFRSTLTIITLTILFFSAI